MSDAVGQVSNGGGLGSLRGRGGFQPAQSRAANPHAADDGIKGAKKNTEMLLAELAGKDQKRAFDVSNVSNVSSGMGKDGGKGAADGGGMGDMGKMMGDIGKMIGNIIQSLLKMVMGILGGL